MFQGVCEGGFPQAVNADTATAKSVRIDADGETVWFDNVPDSVPREWFGKQRLAVPSNCGEEGSERIFDETGSLQPAKQGSIRFQKCLPLRLPSLLADDQIETVIGALDVANASVE